MDTSLGNFLRLTVSGAAAVCLAVQPAGAEVIKWAVGGDEGISWQDQELSSTAMNFDTPGAIQLVAFTS